MIGDSHGRHPVLPGSLDQISDPYGAVEQTVLGVHMQVDKIGVLHEWENLRPGFSSQYSDDKLQMASDNGISYELQQSHSG